MPTPRDIIEDIRRNEYGVGLPQSSPERLGFDKLRPKLDRAIQHLSEDLYTENIHFVLELVQNADDNAYQASVVPFIRFVRREDVLLVQNNEAGFEEEHVRALCSIGESSKLKRLGYIGEKGIGFKSVFRVCDVPHIVSNGFSFRFHREDPTTGLGFVVPEWVEQVPDFVDLSLTNIVLPLRQGTAKEVQKIERLAPTLLLFLRNLKRIEVGDQAHSDSPCYERVDGLGGIELRCGDNTNRYRLVSHMLEVPPAKRDAKRQGVTQTQVMLAFPVAENGHADASGERPVYAYLPVRPYGLSFLVQADFVLASNRESILADRPWNQWLRDEVVPLFMGAVDSFKNDAGALRTSFLAYVPEERPADLFEPIRDRIMEGLRQSACILSAPGCWAKPGDTVLDTFELRSLITDEEVRRLLGRDYVDASFKATKTLLKSLGVLMFGSPELVRCLSATDWLSGKPDDWFAHLFARLANLDLDRAMEELKALAIVPLEDGTLAATKGRRLFLPLDRETSYGFESKIRVVRKSVFSAVDEETAGLARKFLRALGVRKADPAEIIAEYILPLFEVDQPGQDWQSMDDGFCIGSVEYIKDHLKQYLDAGNEMRRLREQLYVKFIHPENRWFTRPSFLYLSEDYGNDNRLETLLDGVPEVRFVHPVYLQRTLERVAARWKKPVDSDTLHRRKKKEADGWRDFFLRLGLVDTIRVVKQPTAGEPDQADSPDLSHLLQAADPSRLRQVFVLLDKNWSYYRGHLETRLVRYDGRKQVVYGHKRTRFAVLFGRSQWVPTADSVFKAPDDVYLDVPATRELLAGEVSYLGAEVKDPRLIDDVGIHREPTVKAALACLRRLSDRRSDDVATVRRLYAFLEQKYDTEATLIGSAFSEEPLLCLPGKPPRYLPRPLVFWHDVGSLFGESHGYLAEHWPEFKRFFVNKLDVPLRPSAEDYARLLTQLAEKERITPQHEKQILAVYREMDRCLGESAEQITEQQWWKQLIAGAVFWTDKREFWLNEGDVFVNNREDLYEVLKPFPQVAFLKVPANQHPHIARFLRAAGIAFLSEALRVEPVITERVGHDPALTSHCRQVVPFIIRYLFYREHDFFCRWRDTGALTRLEEINVRTCDDLQVIACLKDIRVPVKRRFASQFPTIFISRGEERNIDGLAAEMARMLRGSQGLEMFIAAALCRSDAHAIECLMEAQGIPRLPEHWGADASEAATMQQGGGGEGAPDDTAVAPDLTENTGERRQVASSGAGVSEEVGQGSASLSDPVAFEQENGTSNSGPDPEKTQDDQELQGGYDGLDSRAQPDPADTPDNSRSPAQPPDAVGTAPAAWNPDCRPDQAKPSLTEVVPTAIGGTPSARREAPARDKRSSASPEDPEDRRPSPHAVPVGRWGEQYALFCLREELTVRYGSTGLVESASGFRIASGGMPLAEVRWLNWKNDQGVGCDIEVVEGTKTEYVEVKSTSDAFKASFEVTAAQWRLARQQGPAYRILRVFNAGKPSARAESYRDPFRLWQEGRLTARLLQIVI